MIVLKVKPIETIPWIFHAFFTRYGGRSEGPFESLNLSYLVGDDKEAVNANWQKVLDYLPFEEVHLLRQIHSDRVIETDTFFGKSPIWLEDGDALVTDKKGLGIGILTADCAPVLLINPVTRTVAAVHSGWRGTVKRIVIRALRKMADPSHYSQVKVVIGPAISGERYVVGRDVVEAFEETGIDPRGIVWKDPSGAFRFDVQKAIERELQIEGVSSNNIFTIPCCTYDSDAFFSYRKNKKCGRNLSIIGIV